MKLKKIFTGLLSFAAAMAVTSIVSVGASADWNTKKDKALDPGLLLDSSNWIAQVYNVVATPENGYAVYDYGLDLSKIAAVRAVFSVETGPHCGYSFFEGNVGGSLGIGVTITDVPALSELYYKYIWPNDVWYGMEYTTSDGKIINTDPNTDDDPDNDLPVSTKRIGEHTYELVTDYVNPFIEDGVAQIDNMELIFQQWAYSPTLYTVNYVELLDNKGKVMLTFDEYGHPSKKNIAKALSAPPSSVSGLKLKARSADAVRLSWNKNPSADGYIIEMMEHYDGNTVSSDWTTVAKVDTNLITEYRIADLEPGIKYDFRIRSYKMDGKITLCSKYTTITANTKPSAVSGLKVKGRSGNALRLSWNENANADGYIIERKNGGKWTRVAKISNYDTTEYRISKLKAGTAYSFRIKAYKMDGNTALYSGYKSISARTNPSVVSGLKLEGRGAGALRISWNKNTSADGYIIEMKDGSTWTRLGRISKNSTVGFRQAGLKAGTTYTFRVKAYKISGKTALYGAATTLSACTDPSEVSDLKLKASAEKAIWISWTKKTSANGYIVEIKNGNKWTRVSKITNNSTTYYKQNGLKPNTSYTYRVKSYKMSGKTALYSGYKTITVKTK